MEKYNRTNFLNKVAINGKMEYDLSECHFDLLKITRPTYVYECTYDDVGRPDRISRRIYRDQQYWWIILKYNNILDAYNEIYPSKILYAPHEHDLQDWFLKVQKVMK